MFGPLRPPSCPTPHDEDVRAAHACSACHALAELGGRPLSLLTNDHQVFLLLVAAALDPDGLESPEARRCTALPWRSVLVQPTSQKIRTIVAALNVVVVHERLAFGSERLLARAGRAALESRARRARAVLEQAGFPLHVLETARERQVRARLGGRELESFLAPVAEVTAESLAFLAAIARRPGLEEPLRALGRALGRATHAWNAVGSMRDDALAGRFNPVTASGLPLRAVRAWLEDELDTLADALDDLPLGIRSEPCHAVVDGLRARLRERLGDGARTPVSAR